MTDQMQINLTMNPDVDGEMTLLQPILGLRPYVLIQVSEDEGGTVVFDLETGGGVGTEAAEVSDVLELLGGALKPKSEEDPE